MNNTTEILADEFKIAYPLTYEAIFNRGIADAIENAIHHLDNSKANCHEDYIDGIDFAIGVLRNIKE